MTTASPPSVPPRWSGNHAPPASLWLLNSPFLPAGLLPSHPVTQQPAVSVSPFASANGRSSIVSDPTVPSFLTQTQSNFRIDQRRSPISTQYVALLCRTLSLTRLVPRASLVP